MWYLVLFDYASFLFACVLSYFAALTAPTRLWWKSSLSPIELWQGSYTLLCTMLLFLKKAYLIGRICNVGMA
jgi:hypothetical protein